MMTISFLTRDKIEDAELDESTALRIETYVDGVFVASMDTTEQQAQLIAKWFKEHYPEPHEFVGHGVYCSQCAIAAYKHFRPKHVDLEKEQLYQRVKHLESTLRKLI